MSKQNFSVKAILRTDKARKDGSCPINYRVTISSIIVKLPSGQYSEISNWNSVTGFYKGSKSSIQNSLLDKDLSRIKDFLREQRSLDNFLDIELVKSFWSTNDNDDFYEFFDKFCEKKFKELSPGTQYHYELLRNRLKSFRKEIKFSQINLKFIENFDSFLRLKLETGDSGVWSRHKNLKAVFGNAFKNNRIRKNPYDDFKLNQENPEIESLTSTELKLIEHLGFSRFPAGRGLQLSRDMFLFSCYSGLRFSDVTTLTSENIIDGNSVLVKMQKTKKVVQIPLVDKAKKILNKYLELGNNQIFPKRTNVSVNRDLKIIASRCKIKKNIHFHLARHTFATTVASSDANAFIVMKLLGHGDIRMTQRYVNTNVNDLSKTLNRINIFN